MKKGLKGRHKEGQSAATAYKKGIKVGDVSVDFHRTLRVPDDDDGEVHLRPPVKYQEASSTYRSMLIRLHLLQSLGTFPLKPVSACSNTPNAISSRGGFILSIFQREAMWMSFSNSFRPDASRFTSEVSGARKLTQRLC